MGDAAMPRLEQGQRGGVTTHNVAGNDRRIAQLAFIAVEQDQRQFGKGFWNNDLPGNQRGVDDADGLLRNQQVDGRLLQCRVAAGAERGHRDILQRRLVARAVQEGRGKGGGGNLVEHQADDALAPLGHDMGLAAAIAKLFDSLHHAAAGCLRYPGIGHIVEHQGNGGLRYAGELGDIGHGRPLVSAVALFIRHFDLSSPIARNVSRTIAAHTTPRWLLLNAKRATKLIII